MLGSEEKAVQLMDQLVDTAAKTPFDLQGIADGARRLLAYGENVENINDDLIRLGNIAAGLSQPLGDIVYLYGTTMTQGRLYTQDLNPVSYTHLRAWTFPRNTYPDRTLRVRPAEHSSLFAL